MITLNASARYGYGGKQFIARINGRDSKFTFDREFIGKKGGKRGEDSEADVDTPGLYETRDVDSKGRTDDSYCLVLEDGDRLVQIWIDKADAMKVAKELDARRDIDSICKLLPRDAELAKVLGSIKETQGKLSQSWDKDPEEFVDFKGDYGPWRTGNQVRRLSLIEYRTNRLNSLQQDVDRYRAEGRREKDGWRFVSAADEKKATAEQTKAEAAQTAVDAVTAAYDALKGLPEKEVKKALAELRKRLLAKETMTA